MGMNRAKKTKKRKILAAILVLLAAAAGITFFLYTGTYYHAETQDYAAAEENEDYLIYGDRDSTCGLIFYPGAKVEERAYAPILSMLAENGVCCVVVKMPYHLAVLNPDAADQVMEEIPAVEQWYIGGHSLGGAMAADFAAEKEEKFCGLILLAAYPTKEIDMLPVLSIYGSEDGVLNREKYVSSIVRANALTEYVIAGGNHAGFGDYGEQKGDGSAKIEKEEQWQETADYVLEFLRATGGLAEEVQFPVITSSDYTKRIHVLFASEDIYCIDTGEAFLYITQEGEALTADIYEMAYPFHEGLACACKDGKYGYIDREGNTAIDFVYDRAAPFVEGLAYFCKGDSYGFMDETGTPLFYLDCDSVSAFQEELAFICVDGKYGYIDKAGEIVIEPAYDMADYFEDGFAEIRKDNRAGVIDKEGRQVVVPEYAEIERAGAYFIAEKNGKYDIFDREGKKLLEESCDQVSFWNGVVELRYEEQGISGFINRGKVVLLEENYDLVAFLPDRELMIAKRNEMYGVLDLQGQLKIPFRYDYIYYDEEAEAFLATDAEQKRSILNADDFLLRTTCDYDYIDFFVNGQAVVGLDEKYGTIDRDGNLLMPVAYDKIGLFENGAYWYQKDSMSYLYDKDGKLLRVGEYYNITYKDCLYEVETDNWDMGFLDEEGNMILAPVYHNTWSSYDNPGIMLLRRSDYTGNYVIVKTPNEEREDLYDVLLYNEITPKNAQFWEFLREGSFAVEEEAGGPKIYFSEWQGSKTACRIYDFGHTGSPVLYVCLSPYIQAVFPESYSGFFTLQGEEVVCLLSGYECGGSLGGNYMCLWYDTEEEKLLLGDWIHVGGFGGSSGGGSLYDYVGGEVSPRVSFLHISQTARNHDREELLENAGLYYDGKERPYTAETILDADAVSEYYVNGELTRIERYREVTERYRQIFLPD